MGPLTTVQDFINCLNRCNPQDELKVFLHHRLQMRTGQEEFIEISSIDRIILIPRGSGPSEVIVDCKSKALVDPSVLQQIKISY